MSKKIGEQHIEEKEEMNKIIDVTRIVQSKGPYAATVVEGYEDLPVGGHRDITLRLPNGVEIPAECEKVLGSGKFHTGASSFYRISTTPENVQKIRDSAPENYWPKELPA